MVADAEPKTCDHHPDRPVVAHYGHDTMDGGQRPTFKVVKSLCAECDLAWRKKFLVIERT